MTPLDLHAAYQSAAVAYCRAMDAFAPPAIVHAKRLHFLAAQAAWLEASKESA